MTLRLRPLAFALLLAGISGSAAATDLVQAYDLARAEDPQFAASEAQKNATAEGIVQSRSVLLPQVSADANFNRSESRSTGNQVFAGAPTPATASSSEVGSPGTELEFAL